MRNNCCNTCYAEENRSLPAIAYIEKQLLGTTLTPVEALKAGTLFPELFKPMNGEWSEEWTCEVDRHQAMSFAMWELRLYLDTHPDDAEAIALLRQLEAQTDCPNYATTFLTENCNECASEDTWQWLDNMWPWDKPCCVKDMEDEGCNDCDPVRTAVRNACPQARETVCPQAREVTVSCAETRKEPCAQAREAAAAPVCEKAAVTCERTRAWRCADLDAYQAPVVRRCEKAVYDDPCTRPINDAAMTRCRR